MFGFDTVVYLFKPCPQVPVFLRQEIRYFISVQYSPEFWASLKLFWFVCDDLPAYVLSARMYFFNNFDDNDSKMAVSHEWEFSREAVNEKNIIGNNGVCFGYPDLYNQYRSKAGWFYFPGKTDH